MSHDAPFSRVALRLSAGIIIWALHFAVIYGYTGLACARRLGENGLLWVEAVPWVIGISTLAAAGATMPFMAVALRSEARASFTTWISGGVAALALIAIVLEGLTFLWLPACI